MDILNELQYQFGTKGVLEGTQGKDQATEAYQPSLIQRALGISGEQLNNAGDTKQQRDLQKEFGGRLGIYGGKSVGKGENRTSVETRLFERKEDYNRKKRTEAQLEVYNNPTAVEERRVRNEQYTDSRTDIANQMELSRTQYANQMELARADRQTNEKNRLADRIDAREARADDLMFRRESMERADRRDEKNRRRESIQALVAGLSSLGAAFAV